MRFQKPIRGGRKSLGATVLKEIRRKIENIALRHDVSKSFVISVILAEALGVKGQEKY